MLAALFLFNSPILYTQTPEGPRTKIEGVARLTFDDSRAACLDEIIEIPEGRLAGPVISSNPGMPLLPFDSIDQDGKELRITWCITPSSLQTLPVACPRYFTFYVVKESFDADDLGKLIGEWGSAGSFWDLNLDGTVDGQDLAHLLANWSPS